MNRIYKKEFDIRVVKTINTLIHRVVTFFILTAFFFLEIDGVAQGTEQQSRQISTELVGKWCFINLTSNAITNSCVTLNGDGTFEANLDRSMLPNANSFVGIQDSDSGKWWAKGDRIFYTSSANGEGSFAFQKMNHPRLENTPMIVLNGIAFATASSHDPW
jgi:hypothetical protein